MQHMQGLGAKNRVFLNSDPKEADRGICRTLILSINIIWTVLSLNTNVPFNDAYNRCDNVASIWEVLPIL